MCGICGAVWTDPNAALDANVLRDMTEALRHRGPDEKGRHASELRVRAPYESTPGVALGFRRLSIIDLAGGSQPMSNEDGSVQVVFNGEIYNYRSLRNRLEGAGHVFRTQSDTESIVHLYEDEGPDCFAHLNGMFAIAIWDSRRRRLVMARDRLGQKPLVYRHEAKRLLFASELKSLLRVPGVPRDIDHSAVDEYFTYQYVPHPNTIFRGTKKLSPAHLAIYQDGQLEVRPYWQPDFNVERSIAERDAIEQVRELLESSVHLRMQSDVPLGTFLSGGVDSSLIAAIMQKHADQPIKTFSIGFPITEYDERSFARQVAEHIGSEHHEFVVTADAVGILPKLVWHFDEPFADSSAIPTWYLSQLTRQQVTVALSGDGGDELFAGYPRYSAVQLGQWLDRLGPLRSVLGSRIWQRLPGSMRQKSLVRRIKRFTVSLRMTPARRYLDWISIFNEAQRAELYQDEFLANLPDCDPFAFLSNAWDRCGSRDSVTTASLADLVTYLPCDLMTKVDIASMAHSLECRQPFLDHRLVEFAIHLPLSHKLRRGSGKRLLKNAFAHLLPASIRTRKKMGFGVPLDHWFRKDLRELTRDTLLARETRCGTMVRGDVVGRMIEEHESGSADHSYRLWSVLMLELWLREWA